VYGYSFILIDLEGDAAEIEHWHRQRAQIEERVKEVKLGDGLLRFPAATLDATGAVAATAAQASRRQGGRSPVRRLCTAGTPCAPYSRFQV
jgi:hypothetical protein